MTTPGGLLADLASHPFTAGMPAQRVQVLAGLAERREFVAGEWIARQSDTADACHLVLAGRAAVEVAAPGRDPLVIATVHGGEVLGWSWLLPPHRWHFDVVALDGVSTIALDAQRLRAACQSDHALGHEVTLRLAAVIATRLEGTRLQLVDVYGNDR